jgi:hypothetical protein
MSAPGRRIQDALLERYLAKDLSAERRAEVDALLSASEADRARLAELEVDSRAFLIRHPPGRLIARYEKEHGRGRLWRTFAFIAGTSVAAATAALLVFVRPDDSFRAKGGVALSVYRKQGESAVKIGPGEPVVAGDSVRFEVRAAAEGYAAVVGRDGSGKVSVYHPFGRDEPAPYDPKSPLFSETIQLDATPGPEVLYALYGPAPFGLGPVLEALREGKPPPLPPGVALDRVELPKK